ncbi:MAG: ATP-binding protein [Candidatus Auribacterota bacterium]|jgi:DNA transposition AAA+ family ATPase|nr:ATP-binding protein [Candidatus Auribacterota bacterium]
MDNLNKQQIADKLAGYCARYESQNKAAKSLKGVSAATISQMLNNNWELIKEEMWKNVAAQVGYTSERWEAVETRDFRILSALLADARENSNVFAVTGDAGSGKSFALRTFANENRRVYLLSCNEYWNRKMFLQELLSAMGRDYSGFTVGEMMFEVVSNLKKQDSPLVIMDEADKLSDQVLYFFITIYNQLEDHCGIMLVATSHLEKRIKRGIKLNKKGYTEIFSRMGRKFIELKGVGFSDVRAICQANGITRPSAIKEIWEDCEGDLRRVKRKIHAYRKSQKGDN